MAGSVGSYLPQGISWALRTHYCIENTFYRDHLQSSRHVNTKARAVVHVSCSLRKRVRTHSVDSEPTTNSAVDTFCARTTRHARVPLVKTRK